jgi:hypothetical protein
MGLALVGRQGKTLSVDGDVIRIVKEGWFATKREKTIPIRNITSVEVKKPGAFVGFIQFSIAGGMARDSSYTLSGGSIDAVKDENSVVFNGDDKYKAALAIKEFVEAWSRRPSSAAAGAVSSLSVADEIRKLKALMDEGLITAEEFSRKRQQLLG